LHHSFNSKPEIGRQKQNGFYAANCANTILPLVQPRTLDHQMLSSMDLALLEVLHLPDVHNTFETINNKEINKNLLPNIHKMLQEGRGEVLNKQKSLSMDDFIFFSEKISFNIKQTCMKRASKIGFRS